MQQVKTAGASGSDEPAPTERFGSRHILESLEAFREIADGLSGVSEVSEICDRVVAVLKARLGLNTCSIMLVDADGQSLMNVSGTSPRKGKKGPPKVHRSFRIGEGIAGTAAQTGQAVLVPDVSADSRFSGGTGPVTVRSLLCVPIMAESGPMGVLNLSHTESGFFSDDHRTVFSILATMLGKLLTEAELTQKLARFNRDLEDQVAARTREIQTSHAYLEQILFQANDIILTVDWRGRVTYVNRRIRELGYTESELSGQPFSNLCPDGTLPGPLMDAIGGSVAQNVELTLSGQNGISIETYCSFAPMEDPETDGAPGALVLIRDVTRNKRLESQVRQMEKLTAVGTLVAGIAHEINNKLVPILVYAELLSRADLPEKEKKLIKTVHTSAMGARHIMESLLRFSRQEPPKKEMRILNDVVRDVVAMVQYRAKKQEATLECRLGESLPKVRVDGHQVAQVVLNILNNACDAVEGREGTIQVTTSADVEWVRLVVEDNGSGIDKEKVGRIFDPFFTTKEVGKGTGLGLSLCYGIVQEHGGDIQVESRPGCTRFEVILPVPGTIDEVDSPEPAAPEINVPEIRGECLVADDDPVLLDVLQHVLGGHHEVVRESSGKAVIQRLAERSFDLLVLDLNMADMGGDQVYDWIQENQPEMAARVLFMSGSAEDFDRRLGGKVSAERLICKPFRVSEVQRLVEEILAGNSPGSS